MNGLFREFDTGNYSPVRAGIIPYVKVGGKIYFIMGRDYRSGELTDFGGGVEKNEEWPEAALREYQEETYDLMPEITIDDIIERGRVAMGFDDVVIFVPLQEAPPLMVLNEELTEMIVTKKIRKPEISEFVSIESKIFIDDVLSYDLLRTKTKMYSVTWAVLRESGISYIIDPSRKRGR